MKRTIFAIGLALALALFAVPVFAGGWAVITLDGLPGPATAGEPLEIGFMVRQHGQTPLDGLTPIITARLDGKGKPVTFVAEEDGEVGHYAATLILPTEGQWQWEIEAFGMPQSMPALTVTAAAVASQSVEPAPRPAPSFDVVSLLIGAAGLAGIALGMFILRSKRRWAIALVVAGLLVSGYGVVSAATQPNVKEEARPVEAAPASAESQVELGRQLFIAKGCVVCHQHSEVRDYHVFEFTGIPDLTNIKVTPEYLRMWLKDPKSVKPATEMPMLGLSEAEIEELIAFLVAE
jgi:cytochrome c2